MGTSNHLPPRSRAWPWWLLSPWSREAGATRNLVLGSCPCCHCLPGTRPPCALRALHAVRMPWGWEGARGGSASLRGGGEPRRGCPHPRDPRPPAPLGRGAVLRGWCCGVGMGEMGERDGNWGVVVAQNPSPSPCPFFLPATAPQQLLPQPQPWPGSRWLSPRGPGGQSVPPGPRATSAA